MEPPFEISECHLAGCKRGELLLTNEEMEKLNAYLASRHSVDGVPQWRFVSVPSSARGLKMPSVQHPKPATSQAMAPAPRASAPAKKQLPDWALTFHRMLHKFLQADVAKPFAERLPHHSEEIRITDGAAGAASDLSQPITRHSIHNQHQKDIQLVSQPISGIVSPKQVLYKIESGGYPNCLAAFNDLYNFFLCGFRHYPPASPHWILLHNVVTLFFTNLGAFPLKDSFEGPPSILQEKERRAPSTTGVAPERRVEKSVAPASAHRLLRTPMNHDAPVKRKETRALHRILSALSPGLHTMLYEHFKDKAVWKTSEDGQVQLDEENTQAPVFREILNWGASRVTWQVSSGKKKQPKIAAPAPPPTAPATFTEENEPPPSLPQNEQPRRYEGWLSSSDSNKAQTSSSSDEDESEDDAHRAAPTTANFESSDGEPAL